ncbi:hypothetical protein, partial [Rhodopirellula sallentina]|uniref:hypothetical protein n=1 Tax=Rhodopirellula sallentina TaxID=1263869 RepID=UPI001F23FC81
MDIQQAEVFAPDVEVGGLSDGVDVRDQFVDSRVANADCVTISRKKSTTDELQCTSREVVKVNYGKACAR